MEDKLSLTSMDRRTLLKMAGAATLAAPGLTLLEGLSGSAAVAQAATPPTVTLGGADVRPPSIPLAVRSPYLSSWLPATGLTSAVPQFWNGAARGFVGLVNIGGDLYAWAGEPTLANGTAVTPMTAVSTEVTATRSIFTTTAAGVQLVAEWLSPVERDNLQLQSVPMTLLTVTVSYTGGSSPAVQVYAAVTGEWVSSDETDLISWQTTSDTIGRYWTVELQSPQPLSENNQMANWGTVVWAAPRASALTYQSGYAATLHSEFAATGALLDRSDSNIRAINDEQPEFAFAVNFGSSAGSTSFALGHVRTPLISYGQSGTPLQPLWTQWWSGWQPMTAAFLSGAASARSRAQTLDAQIQADATTAAGSGYSAACALALRQCYGGTELAVGADGTPWLLGKEISSDGDTNTVDIFDQAFLAWLYLDPTMIPLVMAPILNWCASPAWQDASAWAEISPSYYCVHDLGVYPVASGRVPGAGEQMPIEESAGMLIMAAAYAAVAGDAATPFLSQWQTLWTQWAEYLMTQLPTPASQLCTDDWAPDYATVAGSVNLGIKAIIGLEAASQIATILGDTTNAAAWSNAATTNVDESNQNSWVSLSLDSSGNYLNLAQGLSGTWSSLYNAYYQLLINPSLLPSDIATKQASYYETQLTTYGMPLQTAAADINKVAWLFYLPAWLGGAIADDLMQRNVDYINDTSSLVPYGDRYNTSTGVEVSGIEAHPTLGAVFAALAAAAVAAADPSVVTADPQVKTGDAPVSSTDPATTNTDPPAATTQAPAKSAAETTKTGHPRKRRKHKPKPKPKPHHHEKKRGRSG